MHFTGRLSPGRYEVAHFDTSHGTETALAEELTRDGRLTVVIDRLEKDLALKLRRVGGKTSGHSP